MIKLSPVRTKGILHFRWGFRGVHPKEKRSIWVGVLGWNLGVALVDRE